MKTTLNFFIFLEQKSPSAYQTWRCRTKVAIKITKKVSYNKSFKRQIYYNTRLSTATELPEHKINSFKYTFSHVRILYKHNTKSKKDNSILKTRVLKTQGTDTLNHIWGINIKNFKYM